MCSCIKFHVRPRIAFPIKSLKKITSGISLTPLWNRRRPVECKEILAHWYYAFRSTVFQTRFPPLRPWTGTKGTRDICTVTFSYCRVAFKFVRGHRGVFPGPRDTLVSIFIGGNINSRGINHCHWPGKPAMNCGCIRTWRVETLACLIRASAPGVPPINLLERKTSCAKIEYAYVKIRPCNDEHPLEVHRGYSRG